MPAEILGIKIRESSAVAFGMSRSSTVARRRRPNCGSGSMRISVNVIDDCSIEPVASLEIMEDSNPIERVLPAWKFQWAAPRRRWRSTSVVGESCSDCHAEVCVSVRRSGNGAICRSSAIERASSYRVAPSMRWRSVDPMEERIVVSGIGYKEMRPLCTKAYSWRGCSL